MSKMKRSQTTSKTDWLAFVVLVTKRSCPSRQMDLLPFVVLALIIGSFYLALVDKNARSTFLDLAKVGVGGYIALMVPSQPARKKISPDSNEEEI